MVGNYILQNWVNGDFISNNLRYINRENKKYFISDVQRTIKSYDKEQKEYVHIYKWATKFFKDNSTAGFRRSVTRLSNKDGVMTHTVLPPSECLCKYTFDEVFGNDLRDIQDPEDGPLYMKLHMEQHSPRAKEDEAGYYKIWLNECKDGDVFDEFLKDLFKVKKVYRTWEITEHKKETILTKSSTLFQITHFGLGKESISFEENKKNHTILFWLFEDRLIYQFESGKSTW